MEREGAGSEGARGRGAMALDRSRAAFGRARLARLTRRPLATLVEAPSSLPVRRLAISPGLKITDRA